MASLIYKPAASGNMEAVEVRLPGSGALIYTFSPGIPTDVLPEHLSVVATALQTLGGNVASVATPTVTLVGPGGSGSYSYKVVTVVQDGDAIPSSAASPPAALGAPSAPTGAHTAASTNLTTGTYRATATYVNAQGESVASAASSAVSASAGDKVTWTLAGVPAGATSVKFYLTAGGSGVTLGFIGSATPSAGTATLDLTTATQGNTTTAPVSDTTGPPAALSGTSYCHVVWVAPSDPTGAITNYKILRTAGGATQGLIATVAANVTSYNDQGATAASYTPAVANPGLIGGVQGPGEI